MNISEKDRTWGFYLSGILSFLSLLTLITYGIAYRSSDYISWISFAFLAAAAAVNIVFFVMNKTRIGRVPGAVLSGVAFFFYLYGMYFYVSVVMVGIDISSFDGRFIINTALFTILFVLSVMNIFLGNKTQSSVKNWKRGLSVFSGIFLGLLLLSTAIVKENEGIISATLGVKTYRIIESEDGEMDKEYFKSRYDNLKDLTEAGTVMGEQAEAEGVVLLKNEAGTLPLKEGNRNVSLFGITSVNPVYGGTGSGSVDTASAPTFRSSMEEAGFALNGALWDFYSAHSEEYGRKPLPGSSPWSTNGFTINEVPWKTLSAATSDSYASFGDTAIFIVGRVGGEGSDTHREGLPDESAVEGNYLKLSTDERDTLLGLASQKGDVFDRIIVLINSANQVETDFIDDPAYKIDSALWIGSVGQVGLNAVSHILAGDIVPSGRLSDTFWNDHSSNPVNANFGVFTYENAGNFAIHDGRFSNYVVYQEGIYLGYRYTETRYEDMVMGTPHAGNFTYADVVTYPFGYGLSYTDFSYSNFKVSKKGRTYTASLDVTNKGTTYSGKEVVQFYVQKPYTDYDREMGIEKAAVELAEFAKTDELAPGEIQTVTVTIDERAFTSYDANGAQTYILDEGEYYIAAGRNAHDALNNILAAKGYTTGDGMDAAGDASFTARYSLDFDDRTYSVSKATGSPISNLFDSADINRLEEAGGNEIKYLSRNNWEETVVLDRNAVITMNKEMSDLLNAQTAPLEEDDTAYPVYGAENGLNLIDMRVDSDGQKIGYDDSSWDLFMDQLSWDDMTYLLSTGLRKTGAVESIAKAETLDHNGPSGLTEKYSSGPMGLAAKTDDPLKDSHAMCYPSNGIIAATFNKDLAHSIGDMIGEDALWAGYAGLYGTGANMHRSPYEGRAFEYYSEDPLLSGSIISRESEGIQSHGCYVYLKHFALNEQEANRTGIGTWANEQTMREIYLKPFEISITEGGAKNVMTSFNRIGLTPSPSSSELLEGFLRGENGMEGFAVTDFYGAYGPTILRPRTILSGNDLPDGDVDAAELNKYKTGYGELAQAMRESAKRILFTVVHSNAMNGISPNTSIEKITPAYIIALTVVDIAAALLLLVSLALILKDMAGRRKA